MILIRAKHNSSGLKLIYQATCLTQRDAGHTSWYVKGIKWERKRSKGPVPNKPPRFCGRKAKWSFRRKEWTSRRVTSLASAYDYCFPVNHAADKAHRHTEPNTETREFIIHLSGKGWGKVRRPHLWLLVLPGENVSEKVVKRSRV